MFGQTRAINFCLLTSSPGRSHDAHRQWMEPALCARFGGLHENILHRRHGRAMRAEKLIQLGIGGETGKTTLLPSSGLI
jgi:hypothetical protein